MQPWKTSFIVLLGVLMLHGAAGAGETAYNQGVSAYRAQDYAGARQHWQQAVAEGEASAMNNLGFLLFNALGGPRDEVTAVSLWTRAARAGQSESQWHLADALERGKGVGLDLTEAYAWYRCAVAAMPAVARDEDDRGILADARDAVIRVLGQLPENKVAEAESRAREYIRRFAPANASE